jgi:hypothetical protein
MLQDCICQSSRPSSRCHFNNVAGCTDAFYRLWPESVDAISAKEPFAAVVAPWLERLGSSKVAFTHAAGGRWLPPSSAIFLDDRAARYLSSSFLISCKLSNDSNSMYPRGPHVHQRPSPRLLPFPLSPPRRNGDLVAALIAAAVPVVTMTPHVVRIFVQRALERPSLLHPPMLREHLRKTQTAQNALTPAQVPPIFPMQLQPPFLGCVAATA